MYQRFLSLFSKMANIKPVHRASAFTPEYRVFFRNGDSLVSPWHDISLFADEAHQTFNMVVEIPRWTNAKMEIATKEKLNPIKQDTKKDKIRFVDNVFPHHGYIWNYGALPQTWEDPEHMDKDTGAKGDNDPIDVCEIGSRIKGRGEIVQVKILGTLAMIDEGETDWKIMAIDVTDPLAEKLHDIQDVEKVMPGFLRASEEWFRLYKVPAGKPENKFAFGGQYKDKAYATKVVLETHEFWKKLIANPGQMATFNTTLDSSVQKMSSSEAEALMAATPEAGPDAKIPDSVDQWHYIRE